MTSNLALSFREESTSPQSLERFLSERGIDFLLVQFVNLHGRPSGKLIPSSAAYESVVRGVPFGGYSAEALGRAPEESDLIARPDLASLTLLPWKPNVAWVAADLTDQSGAEYPYCSRSILRRQLDDLRSSEQLSMQTGPELEYYLVRGNGATLPEPIDETVGPPRSAYSVRRLVGHLDFAAEVTRYLEQMGWEAYAVDHEDGAGQFEHNFKYADALETADRTILFRQMVGALAGKRGLTATFMPKPFMHQAGSGGHLHLSLWRDDKNLFATTPNDGSLQPAELSAMGRSFLAGLLHHAPAYVAITAPLVNSYKRLRPATSVSGHNWTSSVSCWGRENRTALFRIPGGGRIEDRSVDSSANPYLAHTAVVSSGIDGVRRKLDPGPPVETDSNLLAHELPNSTQLTPLPCNLLDATRALSADQLLRKAFGSSPAGDFIDYFIQQKRDEWKQWHKQVTSWELAEYLELP